MDPATLFAVLVERGKEVRPGDDSFAGALLGVFANGVPSLAGHVIGGAADTVLGSLQTAQRFAAGARRAGDDGVKTALRLAGVPTIDEFKALRRQLDALAEQLDETFDTRRRRL